MFLYKIESPEIMEKCNQVFNDLETFHHYLVQVAEQLKVGQPLYVEQHLLFPAKTFVGFSVTDKTTLDTSKWCIQQKVEKHNCYVIRPRKTNKKFFKEYESLVPVDKQEFSYQPIYDLCLPVNEQINLCRIVFKEKFILFATIKAIKQYDYVEEITHSEFLKLAENSDD